ncbi:MAG: S53 family peptidase [Candidatus Korobacteraceae bacterium]
MLFRKKTSTKYTKVPGSERKPMPGATKVGAPDPNELMHVTVVLRSRTGGKKQPSLEKLIAKGDRLTREEYQARYGAEPADVAQVAAFASRHGLTVAQVNTAARTMLLTGRTADFSQAFQVQFEQCEHKGRKFRQRTGAVNIPADLSGIVVSVHGLDNRPQAQAHFRLAQANPNASSTSYTPLQIASAYKFPSGNGTGQTIGIIELGGGYAQSDLQTFFTGLKLPVPTVIAVSVDGAQNAPTGDPNGPDTEVALDIEVAGAVAPGATIVVYFAPNTDAGFLDAINQAAMDTVNKPSVISISWGGPESSWTAQSLQSYNSALQAAASVGVTVCVACGDNGSDDGVGDGMFHVDFPASSPYSLACGGTSLQLSGSNITSEVVWNDGASGGATGGGVSDTFPLPSYQSNADVPPSANKGKFKGRGVPDIAGDADPATGYDVTADGSSFVVGGTSAVAPLWAGLVALWNQGLGKSVGYLNTTMYQNLATTKGTFRDITSGNNGQFKAAVGWDPCSGWGSPVGTAIQSALGPQVKKKKKQPR